ncbi:MAG: hypothetical protein ABII00_05715 [Elusimicrobiota bacterium]
MMYLRFAICLAVGLFGIAVFLKTVLDAVAQEWDAEGDFRKLGAALSLEQGRGYVFMDEDGRMPGRMAGRIIRERKTAAREKQFLAPPETENILLPAPPADESIERVAVPL